MLTSYEKIYLYLTAFGTYEYCTNNPTRTLIKHIIKNYKIFSSKNTKIILGKTFKVDASYISSHYESFCKRIDNSNKNILNIIIELGYNQNSDIFLFLNKVTLEGKTLDTSLPYKEIAKLVSDKGFLYKNVSDDNYVGATLAYNIANYFHKKDNVISGFVFIPQEQSFNKQNQYEFIHNLIEKFENIFLRTKIHVNKIKSF